MPGIYSAERGLLPDFLIRMGIRRLLKQRLQHLPETKDLPQYREAFIARLKSQAIALETHKANEQHYELPPQFFELILGKHLKYSTGIYSDKHVNLDEAEENMLQLTTLRAEIKDGMNILDLGCGWGSLSLWIARSFPNAKIEAVSNSALQKNYIEKKTSEEGITNLKVITSDINHFNPSNKYDRIISIEMFEHMRNYQLLLSKIRTWLQDKGKLFVHIFCHKNVPYLFETIGNHNWMGKYFFTGGMMPSTNIFDFFNNDLEVKKQWVVNGINYQKTCLDWLKKMDSNKKEVFAILKKTYDLENSTLWFNRWRLFFVSLQ